MMTASWLSSRSTTRDNVGYCNRSWMTDRPKRAVVVDARSNCLSSALALITNRPYILMPIADDCGVDVGLYQVYAVRVILPHDAMLMRHMLSPCDRLTLPSVTSLEFYQTAKRRIKQVAPHNSPGTLGRHNLRSATRGLLNFSRYNMTSYGRRAFSYAGPHAWNSLPEHLRQTTSIELFKRSLKTFLFGQISRSAH